MPTPDCCCDYQFEFAFTPRPFVTHRKLNTSGTVLANYDHGAQVLEMHVDSSGNIYVVGLRATTPSTASARKYNSAGVLQWSYDHGTTLSGLWVDGSGNVYVGGARTGGVTGRKLNSSGVEQWNVDHGVNVGAVGADSSGRVYFSGFRTGITTTRQYDSAGNETATFDHGSTFGGKGFIDNDLFYCTGAPGANPGHPTTSKFNTSLTSTLDIQFSPSVSTGGLWVDSSGNIYMSGLRTGSGYTARKYNTVGTHQLSLDTGGALGVGYSNGIATDSSGNIYVAHERNDTIDSSFSTLRKFNSSGVLQWSFDHGDDLQVVWVDGSDNIFVGGNRVLE